MRIDRFRYIKIRTYIHIHTYQDAYVLVPRLTGIEKKSHLGSGMILNHKPTINEGLNLQRIGLVLVALRTTLIISGINTASVTSKSCTFSVF